MAQPLVGDELWGLVRPLIPEVRRRSCYPGRKRIDDRKVLTGILFVLKTGIAWEDLPQELGCGSGMTCWRRLREWQRKSGSKHHLICDAAGSPLACLTTAANRHDVSELLALVEAIPPVRGKRGRPKRRPASLLGDRGNRRRS